MCIIDVYLIPLCLSYYGAILCSLAYYNSHEGLIPLSILWLFVILATVLYILRRRVYKNEEKK